MVVPFVLSTVSSLHRGSGGGQHDDLKKGKKWLVKKRRRKMEGNKIKNRLFASLVLMFLGCASNMSAHGGEGVVSDSEKAHRAEENAEHVTEMMAKIKAKRRLEMNRENKGRSLQSFVAGSILGDNVSGTKVLEPKRALSWSGLSEEAKENVDEKISKILPSYNFYEEETDSIKQTLRNLFVAAAETGNVELVGRPVETVVEDFVRQKSREWLKNSMKVLEILKKKGGLREGTRLIVKKINLS